MERAYFRWVCLTLLLCEAAWGGDYHHMHLGCYRTAEPASTTDGLKYHYAALELGICAAGCNREGYPYVSLQKGKHCLCVPEYGRGGLTFGSACTETCYTDKTFSCGGEETENVYYAVNTDRQVVDERTEMLKTTNLTFLQARKECVRMKGDLVTLKDIFQLEDIVSMVNQSGQGKPFWIGLSSTSWRRVRRWTVPNVLGLDSSDNSMFWAPGHPVDDNHCTLLDPVSLRWQSAQCDQSHPFMCHQVPPPPTQPPVLATDPPTTTLNPFSGRELEDPTWEANKYTILWVILPMFIFCYGGSCVAYTTYKAYKGCKRSKRKFATRNYPRPTEQPQALAASEVITSEPAVAKSRPITPRDITVNETETDPPPYCRTPVGVVPPPRKRTARKAQRKKTAVPEVEKKPEPEPEGEIDFTKLSIADVLYIRAMLGMNTNRNKKRKIITA